MSQAGLGSRRGSTGIMGEFATAEALVDAARQLRQEGFTAWEAYSPAPLDEIGELLPARRTVPLTAIMIAAAVAGAVLGYWMQYWNAVLSYPVNVGGRPFNGWPGFVPSGWEICALLTVYAGFVAFCISCRLTHLHHTEFAVAGFERASQDRFFICAEPAAAPHDAARIRSIFERHGALKSSELPR